MPVMPVLPKLPLLSEPLSDLFIRLPAESITPLPVAYALFTLLPHSDVIVTNGDYRDLSKGRRKY